METEKVELIHTALQIIMYLRDNRAHSTPDPLFLVILFTDYDVRDHNQGLMDARQVLYN